MEKVMKIKKEKNNWKYKLDIPRLFIHPKNFKTDVMDLLGIHESLNHIFEFQM